MNPVRGLTVVMACVAALLGGCSNNDEVVMAKDEALREQETANAQLRARLADQESLRLVEERQRAELLAELDRLKKEREAAPALSAVAAPGTTAPLPAGGRPIPSAPQSAKGAAIRVDDPDLEVEERDNGEIVVRMKGAANLFSPGDAELTANGRRLAGKVAEIARKHPDYRLSIEGHTDDTPLRRTAEKWKNNTNLSIARALAVKNHLAEKGGIPETRMRVVGYGDKHPLATWNAEEARARNRRVEVVFYR
jgi:flagellar motor protein MotB